jgi:hypothetical protein
MIYVTVEPQDVEKAESAFGLIAADACAGCGKSTHKTVTMDAVGWVAALCPDKPDEAIAWVGGYPLASAYCPDCAPGTGRALASG